jgi:hypothetical protein
MSDMSDKHRERKTVFVNADGLKAERLPDLIPAQCIAQNCGCRFWVESPVDAGHCPKCGKQGVRASKFMVLEPFAVEESGGATSQARVDFRTSSMFQVEGDDENQGEKK